ncbi:MAG: 4Fe-4S dicluster domain-containing protein [Candidatus Omnitrophica bacterium]|nr:4Fe-4S dicluster domain-containing protein [Candidatus Omnitrophota bacterium]
MAKIRIQRDKCKGCLLCVSVCPRGALVLETTLNRRGIKPVKHKQGAGCSGCALCALMCPDCCIEVYK